MYLSRSNKIKELINLTLNRVTLMKSKSFTVLHLAKIMNFYSLGYSDHSVSWSFNLKSYHGACDFKFVNFKRKK